MLDRLLDVGARPLVDVEAAEQVQVVRLGVTGRLLLDSGLLLGGEGERQRSSYLLRYLALHLEDIRQLAIKRVAPQVFLGLRVDEMHHDARPRAGSADAAFENGAYPELV